MLAALPLYKFLGGGYNYFMKEKSQKITRAKELRANLTPAEAKLWNCLKHEKLGVKFRRQHPIGKYFVDFICLERKLIIELDGDSHATDDTIKYDNARTDFLTGAGYKLIRIPNSFIHKARTNTVRHLQAIINGEIDAHDYFSDKYDLTGGLKK